MSIVQTFCAKLVLRRKAELMHSCRRASVAGLGMYWSAMKLVPYMFGSFAKRVLRKDTSQVSANVSGLTTRLSGVLVRPLLFVLPSVGHL